MRAMNERDPRRGLRPRVKRAAKSLARSSRRSTLRISVRAAAEGRGDGGGSGRIDRAVLFRAKGRRLTGRQPLQRMADLAFDAGHVAHQLVPRPLLVLDADDGDDVAG